MRTLIRALTATCMTALAASGQAASHAVRIEGMRFEPQELTVRRGDRIVWVNKDLFPHTVTADGIFDSGSIAPNASWSYIAATSGEYAYSCTFHPTMKGKFTVQ